MPLRKTTAATKKDSTPVHVHKRRWFGLLVLRIGLGVIFMAHGASKIHDMASTTQYFGTMGFDSLMAHAVAYVELVGGFVLMLGIFTQAAAIVLAVIMSVVLLYVKQHASITGAGGNELELSLFVSSVAIAFMGAGRFSLGAYFCHCCKRGACGEGWCACHITCGAEHCGKEACDKCETCKEEGCTNHEMY